MTPFARRLGELGLTQAEFSRIFARCTSQAPQTLEDRNLVSRWYRGARKPNRAVWAFMGLLDYIPRHHIQDLIALDVSHEPNIRDSD